MKYNFIIASFLASALMSALHAAVGITGTALSGTSAALGVSAGDVGVWVISDGTAFNTVSIAADADITNSATYGAGFTVLGNNTASSFGNILMGSGHGTDFSFAGDSFALFVYETSTTTADASDTYRVWTDPSWLLPTTDGISFTFASSPSTDEIQQLSGGATFSGTVVPEPSACALISGVLGLGWVMLRRRK